MVRWCRILAACALLVAALRVEAAGHVFERPEWTTPIAPFQIADNLYYVGSPDLASYLVVTPQDDVLIHSSLESSPALIRKSVQECRGAGLSTPWNVICNYCELSASS